ncbi:hypothetical protein ACU609_00870 [Klebsiella aerogenes]|nr:hypothetical protein [Klebsiella aerogenes]HDT3335539.1 hypothetical protein [Klebsiella aerogenes]HDU4031768.1 hypothetical protein [Klebsiella aerogenes]HDU5669801.1 hypothetical protein [Klebsiella aerogenes]
MDDMNFEALPPQQLYDMAVQVLDSSDASKLPDGILLMLHNAKARALRNGAIASPDDIGEEAAKALTFRERVSNAIREIVEKKIALAKVIKVIEFACNFMSLTFSDGELVLSTLNYHSPSFKKPLLVESLKWARAPPFVKDLI